ncbi:MAG TPA: folate-binding protein YgfZ [Pseudomonas sp.]|nr:folate-binding protein YgfZ [Pseudomonas sp.]
MSNPSFYCPISHESLLAVRGVDASKFLQGQLTCNLNYLNEQTSSLGARCTAKGRMLSSFRIVPQGDGYLLAMAAELLEAQMAELQKFAVFSKVKLTDESALWARFGLSHADPLLNEIGLALPADANSVARHGEAMAIRRADGCAELWISSTQAEEIRTLLAVKLTEAPLNDWLLGQIRAGIGQVFGPTRELFIPQMINLQALGGVSFKKGCYTGQEIVARMQYLGKLKRRLYRLSLPGSELPAIASEVFSPVHASAVGEVVLAATADGAVELLAVLQQDAVSDGRLSLQSAAGPQLTLLDLPYTLDSDREIQH